MQTYLIIKRLLRMYLRICVFIRKENNFILTLPRQILRLSLNFRCGLMNWEKRPERREDIPHFRENKRAEKNFQLSLTEFEQNTRQKKRTENSYIQMLIADGSQKEK